MPRDSSVDLIRDLRSQVTRLLNSDAGTAFGEDIFPALAGRALAMAAGDGGADDPDLAARLDAIPSETTGGERRLLYNLFAGHWDGALDVLEIGPFLGGTSRAICLGMLANGRRQPDALFHTFDKFSEYYRPQALLDLLAPMFASGALDASAREAIEKTTSFKEVYEQLHRDQDYYPLLRHATGVLPGEPSQTSGLKDLFAPPPDRRFSAVFVDGAKSWYGMKYFMRAVVPKTSPGALYIFQDYGAHTCFWVPVFLEIFQPQFRLLCYADHTYVFRYERELSSVYLGIAFPDAPDGLDVRDYVRIFRSLGATAVRTNNHYAIMNYQLQHAGALAHLGHLDEARRLILALLDSPFASRYRPWILRALEVPTYTPHGNVSLY